MMNGIKQNTFTCFAAFVILEIRRRNETRSMAMKIASKERNLRASFRYRNWSLNSLPLFRPLKEKIFNDGSLLRLLNTLSHRPTCHELLLLRLLCEALYENIGSVQANAVSINSQRHNSAPFPFLYAKISSTTPLLIHRLACMKIFSSFRRKISHRLLRN